MQNSIKNTSLINPLEHYTSLIFIAKELLERKEVIYHNKNTQFKIKQISEMLDLASSICTSDLSEEITKNKNNFILSDNNIDAILTVILSNTLEFFDSMDEEAKEKAWLEESILEKCFSLHQVLNYGLLTKQFDIPYESIFSGKIKNTYFVSNLFSEAQYYFV